MNAYSRNEVHAKKEPVESCPVIRTISAIKSQTGISAMRTQVTMFAGVQMDAAFFSAIYLSPSVTISPISS